MEVYQAAEIILKAVHDDMNGNIVYSHFLAHQTQGYDERTTVELQGIYNKALLVLIDESLCHRGVSPDNIELGQKGIACKGNFKKYLKKKNTASMLEKGRRIAPILSFVFVASGFYITYIKKKHNNERKAKATIAQHRKDSITARQREAAAHGKYKK